MIERVQRVVIGAEPGQESRLTHVEEVERIDGGAMLQWAIWGWDALRPVPHVDSGPYDPGAPYPAPGGLRVVALRAHGDTAEPLREMGRALPGFVHDEARPGMHSTDTVDVAIVVEGQATVEAGDGTKATLGPGDVYVCNGAMHRWHYDEPTHIVFVVFGAERHPETADS